MPRKNSEIADDVIVTIAGKIADRRLGVGNRYLDRGNDWMGVPIGIPVSLLCCPVESQPQHTIAHPLHTRDREASNLARMAFQVTPRGTIFLVRS